MEDKIEQSVHDIVKVYIAQMDSAVRISKIICEHSDREELTGDDIICGLVYRLMIPMTEKEINESLNTADEILDGSSSEEDEEFITEDPVKPEIRKIRSNQCNCDICSKVRVCLCNFNDNEPKDEMGTRFKDSINVTCNKYKIYI